jgi:hypothetical protein
VTAVVDALATLMQEDLALERQGRPVVPPKPMSQAQLLYMRRQQHLASLVKQRPGQPPAAPLPQPEFPSQTKPESESSPQLIQTDSFGYLELSNGNSTPYAAHLAFLNMLKDLFQAYGSSTWVLNSTGTCTRTPSLF